MLDENVRLRKFSLRALDLRRTPGSGSETSRRRSITLTKKLSESIGGRKRCERLVSVVFSFKYGIIASLRTGQSIDWVQSSMHRCRDVVHPSTYRAQAFLNHIVHKLRRFRDLRLT